jgi:hypothetical protein
MLNFVFKIITVFFLTMQLLQVNTTLSAENLSGTKIPFVKNVGQAHKDVAYYAPTFGGTMFVSFDGILTYSLHTADSKCVVLKERLVAANKAVKPVGLKRAHTQINYLLGADASKHRIGVPTYEAVSMTQPLDGLDLTLKSYGANVEKLFTLAPDTAVSEIVLEMQGMQALRVDEQGRLMIMTELGEVAFTTPIAYQMREGQREAVDVAYWTEKDRYGFKVGEYDKSRELIIDPLLASTFVGGIQQDYALDMALASDDSVYFVGFTSAPTSYPATPGVIQENADNNGNGYRDIIVSHLSADLSTLNASTYLGGRYHEYGTAIEIAADGTIFIAGHLDNDTSPDFPMPPGPYVPYDSSPAGYGGVVAHLSADMTVLIGSTYIDVSGNYSNDNKVRMDISEDGLSVYVTGYTYGTPFSGGTPYQGSNNGSPDAVIVNLAATLSTLNGYTYLGGSDSDLIRDVKAHNGFVYVTGYTNSTDFPITDATSLNGGVDIFVSRLSTDLTALNASTYIGGASNDRGQVMQFASDNSLFLAGITEGNDFPGVSGHYDDSHAGGIDVVLAHLSADLATLNGATYLGGADDEKVYGLARATDGSYYLSGTTQSSDFPVGTNPYDGIYGGGGDIFISLINSALDTLMASTFVGAPVNQEIGYGLGVASDGTVVVAGQGNINYPTTNGAYDELHNGGIDVVVSKLDAGLSGPTPDVTIGDASATEGGDLVFNVNLSERASLDIVLELTTADGTAEATGDYTSKTENVTITAGTLGTTFTVETNDDVLDENDNENMTVSVNSVVSGPSGSVSDTGTGTISDNDEIPELSINDVAINENSSPLTFTVSLSEVSGRDVQFTYTTADDTATAGSDYTGIASMTGTISAGAASVTVEVAITDDILYESDETFNVNLSQPTNATLADDTGIGTIIDNESSVVAVPLFDTFGHFVMFSLFAFFSLIYFRRYQAAN